MPPLPTIRLPLNAASLWASTFDDLHALYSSDFTGAVTTRTAYSTDSGFPHNNEVHQHAFISLVRHSKLPNPPTICDTTTHPRSNSARNADGITTLNTIGYSPLSLKSYIRFIIKIQEDHHGVHKPVIFSVAGSSSDLLACYDLIARNHDPDKRPWEEWCMEINLSCPNIAGSPPPAYSASSLNTLLRELYEGIKTIVQRRKTRLEKDGLNGETVKSSLRSWSIPIGLKLPPYTWAGQFDSLVEAVRVINSISISSSLPHSDGRPTADELVRGDGLMGISSKDISTLGLGGAIDPSLLTQKISKDLDSTLAHDLAVSLTLDDALSQAPSGYDRSDALHVLTQPFPIAFLTATNTLGSCLHLSSDDEGRWLPTLKSIDGSGMGGLAGASLHPLALGNVRSLRKRLNLYDETRSIRLIGVGGVSDVAGFDRMRAAGADSVAVATALGIQGVAVFSAITEASLAHSDNQDMESGDES